MAKFDAFAGGIDYGGLRSMLDIKILVCYILNSVKVPMTRAQISDAMQQTGLVNFFDVNSAIDELLENGAILEKEYVGEPHLVVSRVGANSAMELEKNLLPGVRDRAVKTALNIVSRARSERENKVTIEKLEDSYNVTFEIESLGQTMLSLTLNVADVLQTEQLKDGFLNDPGALYSDIIDRLVGDK